MRVTNYLIEKMSSHLLLGSNFAVWLFDDAGEFQAILWGRDIISGRGRNYMMDRSPDAYKLYEIMCDELKEMGLLSMDERY